ncbi:MAG: glycosyltransferase family 2 protein [Planctomycetes bacterium]|nr:glycosyltransferase family 2 protein [Planctomycetota bacterium]
MPADTPVPSVAIVIPCYNHGAYLPEAVASVHAQTYAPVECVVVDDGSTDAETRRVLHLLQEAGTRVISQPNQGLAAARNAGVRATEAAFFVPLDADDQLEPGFVERLLPALQRDPQVGFCYCHVQLFGTSNDVWRCLPYDRRRAILYNLCPATALIRRAAFDEVGGYQSDMVHGYEDWDFWLALAAAGYEGRLVPARLLLYRQHEPGVSMRDRVKTRHEEMTRRMIAHHDGLYRALLGLSDVAEEQIFDELMAAVELDHILRARLWRVLHPFARPDVCVDGPFADSAAGQTRPAPRQRLARVRASAAYRLIAALKRTRLHRWYARRKYGAAAEE